MPDFSDWSRADIISAIALLVSCLAFVASAASAVVSWLGYRASTIVITPTARGYFEPFESGSDWWILHLEINNRSHFILELQVIAFLFPIGSRFTKYFGGFSGVASGGGPMMYSIPPEVDSEKSSLVVTGPEIEQIVDLEIPAQTSSALAPLIVKMPKARFWRKNVWLKVALIQHMTFPRRMNLNVFMTFPTRATVRHRF